MDKTSLALSFVRSLDRQPSEALIPEVLYVDGKCVPEILGGTISGYLLVRTVAEVALRGRVEELLLYVLGEQRQEVVFV